jgi:hypothetical protein
MICGSPSTSSGRTTRSFLTSMVSVASSSGRLNEQLVFGNLDFRRVGFR